MLTKPKVPLSTPLKKGAFTLKRIMIFSIVNMARKSNQRGIYTGYWDWKLVQLKLHYASATPL